MRVREAPRMAVASAHGEVRCDFFSGCAVRTALTPAPFPRELP